MTPRHVLLLAALVLAAPVTAQAGRVEIRLDPTIPIAGRSATVTARFLEARPEAASLFVRAVGETTFLELVASEQTPSLWSVAAPFDIPRQGVEVYAQYRLDGETFTEPVQAPQEMPFRVPSFVPVTRSDVTLPVRQYRMVSVPLHLGEAPGVPVTLGSDDPVAVFGDDFGDDGDPAQWRLLRWDPLAEAYRDAVRDAASFDRVRPGAGYWLITSRIGTFDVENGLSTGAAIVDGAPRAADVTIPIQTGWNQIGSPFLFPIQWADVGRPAGVEDPVAFTGTFVGGQATLRPWEGYFVFNPGPEGVLRFRARPGEGGAARTVAERVQERAGVGAGVLHVTASQGGVTDEVVLGVDGSAAGTVGGPVDLRKPPAVDSGLRLSARADGEEWISRFQPRDAAVWTVTVAADDDVDLDFTPYGDWPDGLVVEDLDRGEALAVVGDRVRVEAIDGAPIRRLAVRAGTGLTAAPAGPSFGTPRPNPTTGAVTVPVTLPGPARFEVVDVLGRVVRATRLDGTEVVVGWDGQDGAGCAVAAGVYLLRLSSASGSAAARVTLLSP
ncbi:T9SS type A sorting domain-containing protein [Rubrivirga marina]|uniref:FlgD Ig-like domain-containing protein n=1 Tax=Rubrivirga marina TaxID=1196024 RepID=A0A271IY68_9BACT|nr:T9SS type A sorting domain-containing protein [Rubrivirga marina]PAP75744.1 hypothetical protein BSZ37_04465 [Rubrivirga marina]